MLEKTEGAIKNGQFNETDNIRYTRQTKQKHNTTHYVVDTTICKQNNANKT
jgi:hypothetical protein